MPLGQDGNFGYVSPYWNPSQFPTDYGGTPWGQSILEKSPQTAFYRYMRQLGAPIEQETPFSKFLQQQYGNFLTGYGAYTVSDPMHATIGGYMQTLPQLSGWERLFNQMAPSQRGVNYAGYGAGPARWVG